MRGPSKAFPLAWKTLAILWAALLFCLLSAQLHFLIKKDLSTDWDALAPTLALADAQEAARQSLTRAQSQQLIVMIGISEKRTQAFDSFFKSLPTRWPAPDGFVPKRWTGVDVDQYFDFYKNYTNVLMTTADERAMRTIGNDALFARAYNYIHTVGNIGFLSKAQDPLGFFKNWTQARLTRHTQQQEGHFLKVFHDGRAWGIMSFQGTEPFNLDTSLRLLEELKDLRQIVKSFDPESEILIHGPPYRNAYFTQSTLNETKQIFIIATVLFCIFTWTYFRRFKAVVILCFSMGSSFLCALTFTTMLYPTVHLWTVSVGSLLLGISAACTGSYYCILEHDNPLGVNEIHRRMAVRLSIILLAVSLPISLLLLTPLPSVQQLATFLLYGILSSFLTTVLLLPYLDHGVIRQSAFMRDIIALSEDYPRLRLAVTQTNIANYATGTLALIFLLMAGYWQLNVSHDIRNLTNFSAKLRQQSENVSQMLDLPSPNHYFIVTGATPEIVLMHEEALRMTFDQMGLQGNTLWCVSKWTPSLTRQKIVEQTKLRALNQLRGPFENHFDMTLPTPTPTTASEVTIDQWLAHPASSSYRYLWLTLPNMYGSIVQISNVQEELVPVLKAIAAKHSGIVFVSQERDYNEQLSLYRTLFLGILSLLIVGYSTLTLFYSGLYTWRILAPTLLSVMLTVVTLSLAGAPFKLFTALAITILFGLSYTFALFIVHAKTHRSYTTMTFTTFSIAFSALLLQISASPTIRTFGITIGLGLIYIWLLAPLFRIKRH